MPGVSLPLVLVSDVPLPGVFDIAQPGVALVGDDIPRQQLALRRSNDSAARAWLSHVTVELARRGHAAAHEDLLDPVRARLAPTLGLSAQAQYRIDKILETGERNASVP